MVGQTKKRKKLLPGFFNVERVVDKRFNEETGGPEYLIKWEGYPWEVNTWEPPENILNPGFVEMYERQQEAKRTGGSDQKVSRFDGLRKVDFEGLEPEEIIAADRVDGHIVFRMKWKENGSNVKKRDFVPSELANQLYPALVIGFYESHICWHKK